MCVIRRHFLACEDSWWVRHISGGHFISRNTEALPVVPDVRWRNHYFARNKEAFPCVRSWTQLSASPHIVHVRWKPFLDHVNHTAPSASKVVDDGEAPDNNEPEMGRQGVES